MYSRAYIEITNRCNLRCAFCPGTQRPLRDMTAAEFALLADKLRPVTGYLYFHIMGEPLLHPHLGDLLSLAAERGFRVCLTTNGTLLPQVLDTLLHAPALHKVSVSLHSFEGNEGGPDMAAYLAAVWDAAARLARQGTLAVLRLWNEGGLESRNGEILDFLARACGQPETQWPDPRPGTRKLGERVFLESASRFQWPDLQAAEQSTEFCHGLRSQIGVLCDGTVVPCCLDHEGDLALGNLLTQSLDDILNGPRARAIYDGFSRRAPTEELCRRCGYAARFNDD